MSTSVGDALKAIAAAGLIADPVILYAYSATVANGDVISQSPAGGASVPWNTPVQLTVSLGVANPAVTTTVPNVVGLGFIEAQSALVAAFCAVGALTWVQGSAAIGSVTAQSPASGGVVAPWVVVALTVCSGPVVSYPGTGDLTVPTVS